MERKNYRIIALDMDGTLLTSDKTIAPDTVRDIRAASERGIHVVYCTGRAVPELKLYFDMVPMMRYAVCSTGALVYDRVEKHCIDRRPVKSEMAYPHGRRDHCCRRRCNAYEGLSRGDLSAYV